MRSAETVNRRRKTLTLVFLGLCFMGTLATAPQPAIAAGDNPAEIKFTPEIPLPGLFDKADQTVDNSLLANYIKAIYVYFIWVVGIVAVVMVIYGGVRWVAAAGNPGRIKEARDIIDNAVIGVIIGLTSVVLLNIINPKLTKISLPGLATTTKEYQQGLAINTICTFKVTNFSLDDLDNPRCGQIVKTGTTKDKNGKTVDAYCMGTMCPYGTGFGLYAERRVCSLKKGADGYFAPADGCIATVPIETAAGSTKTVGVDRANVTNRAFSASYSCGIVSKNSDATWDVGHYCSTAEVMALHPSTIFLNTPKCYMLGTVANVKDRPGPLSEGEATNMSCPPMKP